MKVGRIILIILILMSTAALVYSPHLRYKYPLHADEWNRIALAKALDHGEDVVLLGMKYEIVFISFLRFLGRYVDLLMFYRFLPAIFAAFTSLCLFFFVYYLSRNYYLSILSMIFYATIKSNVNILGPWFFVALTMASPFIFLYSLFFIKGFREGKFYNLVIALLILAFMSFIHPITVFFLLIISFIYFLFNIKNIDKKFFKKIFGIGVLGMAVGIYLIFLFNIKLSEFHFKVWTYPSVNYNLAYVYGVLPLLFAFLGLGYLVYKKKHIYLVGWFLFGFFSFLFYKLFKFMFLIPYERGVYYFVLGLPILTAYGFGYFSWLLKKKNIKFYKLIFVIVLVLTLVSGLYNYHSFHMHKYVGFDEEYKNLGIYWCIENEDNFTEEAGRCVYKGYKKYLEYVKDG